MVECATASFHLIVIIGRGDYVPALGGTVEINRAHTKLGCLLPCTHLTAVVRHRPHHVGLISARNVRTVER